MTKWIMKGGKLLNVGVVGFSVKSDKNIWDAETVGLWKTTLGFRFIINGVHYKL